MIKIGTLFKEIYATNEILKNDDRLKYKPQNLIYELYFTYLKYAIGLFRYDSYVDLTARTNFSQQIYNYISDGSDNVYLLDPPPLSNSEFYVGYRPNSDVAFTQVYDTDFTYNPTDNTITTNITIPKDYEVYIASYIVGEFENNLNEIEIDILSEGMLVPWSTEQEMKNSLLNMMAYGGESRVNSQANHIKEVKDVANNQYFNKVKGMISDYSYKYNPNKSKGLGGGLI